MSQNSTLPGLEPMSSLASQTILSSVLVLLAHITTPPSTHTPPQSRAPGGQTITDCSCPATCCPSKWPWSLGQIEKRRHNKTAWVVRGLWVGPGKVFELN